MPGKYIDPHGNIAFRYFRHDARSSTPPPDIPTMPNVFKHNSIQAEVMKAYKSGVPRDDIWESLWNVLRAKHPQMSNSALDAWVNELTRPIY